MKRFAISDIHGAYDALMQVLGRCGFDMLEDELIFVGDIVDGFESGIVDTIKFMTQLEHHIWIKGNHDKWALDWLGFKLGHTQWGLDNGTYRLWTEQGGQATLNAMKTHDAYELVYDYLSAALDYYEDDHNLFVHGGIRPGTKAENNLPNNMIWDRRLIQEARLRSIETDSICPDYDTVFIGHSPVINYNRFEPTRWNNVMAIDCGASYPNYNGRLGIVNVDTLETWVSDPVKGLYPNEVAR